MWNKLCILRTWCIYVFLMILNMNNDYLTSFIICSLYWQVSLLSASMNSICKSFYVDVTKNYRLGKWISSTIRPTLFSLVDTKTYFLFTGWTSAWSKERAVVLAWYTVLENMMIGSSCQVDLCSLKQLRVWQNTH